MRQRLLVLLACTAVCLGTALVTVPQAATAFDYQPLPMCAGDPDGKLCVVSATRNGVTAMTEADAMNAPDGSTNEWYYVDNGWRDGVFGFNLNTKTTLAGPDIDSKSVDASATWVITVNTGSYYPRELNAKTQNTVLTRGGNPTTGYWFRIQFNPVPVAWRFYDSGFTCNMTSCGDDSTVANFVSDPGEGFADGYVSDLADSPSPRYVSARTGFIMTSNAQYQQEPEYDATTNSLVVSMANPHLSDDSPVTQAKGFFEAFLPNAYLTSQLGVPYPSTLTGGSVVVQRVGATTTTPFTLTHTSTGIWIRVQNIGFSRPRFRLSVRPSPPGKPRAVVATKISAHKARVRFAKPIANGGRRIDWYQAACHRVGGKWHYSRRSVSPITVTSLPKGRVWCKVRAHNAKGYGKWSALDRS